MIDAPVHTPRINWFPGHMRKALREAGEKLKLVDLVLEVRDARLPFSTGNTDLEQRLGNKKRLIIINKTGYADPGNLAKWEAWFQEQNLPYLAVNALDFKSVKKIVPFAAQMMKERNQKYIRKGIKPPPLRMMVMGLPNTGKSTLINSLTQRKATVTGNRPGVTKAQSWISIKGNLELMDTPGIMPPRIITDEVGMSMVAIHAIKDEIPGKERLGMYLMGLFLEQRPHEFIERFGVPEEITPEEALELVATKVGALKKGGVTAYDKAHAALINEYRKGKLGRLVFEWP